jgi:hypothetical protein
METISEEFLTIEDIQVLRSKNGREYHQATTDKGKYTIFEGDIVKQLKKNFKYSVEVATSDKGFKNIRKILQEIKMECPSPNNFSANLTVSNKEQAMYTSYAKDIYIAYLEHSKEPFSDKDLSELCIGIVKRFKEAFK